MLPDMLRGVMCDMPEEEQAEYLLWLEAVRARATERQLAPREPPRRRQTIPVVPEEPVLA